MGRPQRVPSTCPPAVIVNLSSMGNGALNFTGQDAVSLLSEPAMGHVPHRFVKAWVRFSSLGETCALCEPIGVVFSRVQNAIERGDASLCGREMLMTSGGRWRGAPRAGAVRSCCFRAAGGAQQAPAIWTH